jgi:hypothetical protein
MLRAVVFGDAIVALAVSIAVRSERCGSSSVALREHQAWDWWIVDVYLHTERVTAAMLC